MNGGHVPPRSSTGSVGARAFAESSMEFGFNFFWIWKYEFQISQVYAYNVRIPYELRDIWVCIFQQWLTCSHLSKSYSGSTNSQNIPLIRRIKYGIWVQFFWIWKYKFKASQLYAYYVRIPYELRDLCMDFSTRLTYSCYHRPSYIDYMNSPICGISWFFFKKVCCFLILAYKFTNVCLSFAPLACIIKTPNQNFVNDIMKSFKMEK